MNQILAPWMLIQSINRDHQPAHQLRNVCHPHVTTKKQGILDETVNIGGRLVLISQYKEDRRRRLGDPTLDNAAEDARLARARFRSQTKKWNCAVDP